MLINSRIFFRAAVAATVCSTITVAASAQATGNEGVLVTVASGLNQPIGLMNVPGDSGRLFVIGKTGMLYAMDVTTSGQQKTYTLRSQPAIDLTSVVYAFDNRGLTGMAFPPDYQTSGYVYLFTNTLALGTDQGAVVRYQRDPSNPSRFDPASRQVIFSALVGPYHHGGCLRFGPDGYLYMSKGDEGNIGILQCRNPGTFYGKILRFDVSRDDFPIDPLRNYGIPAGNPFAHTSGGLPEVWAMGLRSPWQFSFDRQTGDLWVGDVGENSWEELSCLPAQHSALIPDFGWPSYEGLLPGPFGTMGADPTRLIMPAYAYPHTVQPGFDENHTGCSVNGGFVYRGSNFPAWRGRYFWSDVCSSRIFSGVRGSNGAMTDVMDMTDGLAAPEGGLTPDAVNAVVAFGEDNDGELFIIQISGLIQKIVPRARAADIGRAGGIEGADGELNNNDFVVFINWFFSADARCDYGKSGGLPGGDGIFDNNDLIVFVSMFFQQLSQQP